ATGDVNRDGKTDLIVLDDSGLQVYLGTADGISETPSFSDRNLLLPSMGYSTAIVGDFDGDGNPDVVVGGYASRSLFFDMPLTTLSWYRGRGDGTFALRMTPSIPTPLYLAAADLDGDRITDLIAGSPISNAISIFTSAEAFPRSQVVSPASNTDAVAPGALATVYGSGWAGKVTLEVVDASGTARPASVLFFIDSQINFQIPDSAAPGSAQLLIHASDGSTQHVPFRIQPLAPALFSVGLELFPPAIGMALRI